MLRVNRLYYGDCLTILQDETASQSVDLIYLDPPFNSNRGYNAIYRDETGRELPDQVDAFCDMWELEPRNASRSIRHMPVLMRDGGIVDDDVVEFWRIWMNALRGTQPRLLAYLSYMVQRLLPMRLILKPTGSIYYHCDPTASHYIKVMMDGIFGHANFQNEFIWHYGGGGASQKRWARKHDVLLFYSRGRKWVFNTDDVRTPHKWTAGQRRADGSERDERGKIAEDVWSHNSIMPWSKERMGYPTQKPLELLERVIKASSNPGDVVLDPFAGCATTMEAAQKLGRQWIGIDIAIHAVKRVARVRLEQRMGLIEGQDFTIEGVPRDVEGARDLWKRDTYQFQKWAVEHADGFVTAKRTSDGGIDGRLYFAVPDRRDLQSMVIEVKGGRSVNIADVRALRGVLDNDSALIAGLVVLENPGPQKARNFARFMGEAGTIEILGIAYPRMQVLTVAEIIEGKRFHTPSVAGKNTLEPQLPGIPRQ